MVVVDINGKDSFVAYLDLCDFKVNILIPHLQLLIEYLHFVHRRITKKYTENETSTLCSLATMMIKSKVGQASPSPLLHYLGAHTTSTLVHSLGACYSTLLRSTVHTALADPGFC